MTQSEFRDALVAIYGPHVARHAGEDLGVSRRTVERWLAGTHPAPWWAIRSVEKTKELMAVDDAIATAAGFR